VELIGTVVRLQVQRSRLKPGERGERVYDPAPLLQVDEMEVGPRGVVGLHGAVGSDGGERVVDVHHADHVDSRNGRLRNGLSVLPLAHYRQMRERYGEHLADGAAGESLLLDTAGPLTEDDLAGQLLLETVDGPALQLSGATAAPPCVEFSRFALRLPVGVVDDAVRGALVDLAGGVRGFYVAVAGEGRVRSGARLLRA